MELRRRDFTPGLISLPPGDNILVLAPHMDDEIIGCGGTLHKHVLAGGEVTVAFLTDGRKGHRRSKRMLESKKKRITQENEVAKIRREEAQKAADVIGINSLIFLAYPDRNLALSRHAVHSLQSVIQKVKPDLVYLPFLTDPHHDHRMTNKIFVHAIKNGVGNTSGFICAGYEVWNPIYPNCIVEIKDVIEVKKKALLQYQSQLEINYYINSIFGLHSYRAITLGSQSYAEAFFVTTAKDYINMYNQMDL